MHRLYLAEWKKLWKNRVHQVCLLMLMLCIVYLGFSSYQKFFSHRTVFDEVIGEDGVTYHGMDALLYLDAFHHRYAGSIDQEWVQKRDTLIEAKAKENNITLEIDEQAMQENFGEHWREYYEACEKQTLTYKDYSEIYPSIKNDPDYDPDALLSIDRFALQYTQESASSYFNIRTLYSFHIPFYVMDRERYLLTPEKVDASVQKYNLQQYVNAHEQDTAIAVTKPYDSAQIEAINAQLMSLPMVFDASWGYTYFMDSVNALSYVYVVILVLMAVLISGIFSQEYSCKTDQILRSVQFGNKQQAIAKLFVGLTICFFVFLSLLLCIWGIPYFMIGYYSLAQAIDEWPITMAENMRIFIQLLGVSCFAYGSIFLWISSKTKGRFSCLVACLLCLAITYFGGFVLQGIGYENAPGYLIGPNIMMPFLYEPAILFDFAIMKCDLVAICWGLLTFVFLYLTYRHYKNREIQNA